MSMDIKTLFKKFEERKISIDNEPWRYILWDDVKKIFRSSNFLNNVLMSMLIVLVADFVSL